MRLTMRTCSWMIGAMLGCSTAWSHHSTALFDYTASKTLQGVVKSFQWANPHNYVQILVPDDKGGQTEWSLEVGTPATAVRQGWTRASFKAGDKVTVVIAPMKDGSAAGSIKTATLADGRTLSSVAAEIAKGNGDKTIAPLQRAEPAPK